MKASHISAKFFTIEHHFRENDAFDLILYGQIKFEGSFGIGSFLRREHNLRFGIKKFVPGNWE